MKVAIALALLVAVAQAAITADQITSLPGWSAALPSNQYSGYLTFGTKHVHYWFVESQTNPATAPVVVWFNGGPGCSSLGGYMYEHGPFHVNEQDHTQLYYNNYTWTTVANVIYIEAPVGVGFSYSDNPADYHTDDNQTAADNLNALEVFFQGFPEFLGNDFFITGESYAGIYVPTLAQKIMEAQEAKITKINLKGFAVGNGCTGTDVGSCSNKFSTQIHLNYYYAHGLFSDDTYQRLLTGCKNWTDLTAPDCLTAQTLAAAQIGGVNIYDIYADCINGDGNSDSYLFTNLPRSPVGGPDECIDSIAASAYLNIPEVQAAIHVKPAPSGNWSVCGSVISYRSTEKDLPKDLYPKLISKYRVLIYSGDVDGCVPYTDSEEWTAGMGYPVKHDWHAWTVDDQVAGYVTVYGANDFTFATVKGAGHMVPQFMPPQALYMFTQFISGEPL